MNILFGASVSGKSQTGVPNSVRRLGARLEAAGHRVDYAFLDDFPALNRWGQFAQFGYGLAIVGRIRRGRYDVAILHSADGFWYSWLRRLIPWAAGTRAVMVSHGLEHRFWERFVEQERRGRLRISLRHKAYTKLVRNPQVASFIRRSDLVFVLSKHERDYVVQRGWKPAGRVRVIPNGVDVAMFAANREDPVQPRLLFVGPWQWRKGVEYLAEAFGVIGTRFPSACLTLVGPHESEEEIRRNFAATVNGRVSVVQSVPPDEMAGWYRSHDLFVFPTLFEGDPLTLREAMAAGMAIVTTDMFPMKEVVVAGETGLLVPPGDAAALADAVCRLIEEPGLARRLGENARLASRTRTWDDVAKEVTEALA